MGADVAGGEWIEFIDTNISLGPLAYLQLTWLLLAERFAAVGSEVQVYDYILCRGDAAKLCIYDEFM
jgi:hypothetical protein